MESKSNVDLSTVPPLSPLQKPSKSLQRNKIFTIVFSALFVFVFIVCPAAYLMDRFGILPLEDLANYKDPDRLYFFDFETRRVRYLPFWDGVNYLADADIAEAASDEGFVMPEIRQEGVPFFQRFYISVMNGIQRTRANVSNIYTNFLPFYEQMLEFESFNNRIDSDFTLALHNWEAARADRRAREAMETMETTMAYYDETSDSTLNLPEAEEPETESEPLYVPEPIWWDSLNRARMPENASSLTFIANRVADAGMFRVTQVRTPDNSFGFLEISKAMTYQTARRNMIDELYHVNRIAEASRELGVNFFKYFGTTPQSTPVFNDTVPLEFSSYEMMMEFVDGIRDNVTGVDWFDISTLELRLERVFLTDHHWNAYGAVSAYRDVINMMREIVPEIGEPFPLTTIHYFPEVRFRGSGAGRTNTPTYYDLFAVPVFELPEPHPNYRVTSRFDYYERGHYDFREGNNRLFYQSHYEHFYSHPSLIRHPSVNNGRRLLVLGDSMLYWVLEPIAAHFEETRIHYTLHGNTMDYAQFIERHGITDVLLLQYAPRTLAKSTSATVYLEQIITR